jgi:hypothetical protein
MTTHKLIPIPFHKDTLYLIDEAGKPYVPVRPIVENLSLDWKVQYRKLMAAPDRWGVVMMTTPSAGGPQQALCIPMGKTAAFLFSIDPNKVKAEARPGLVLYQERCDVVLADFWMGTRCPPTSALPEPGAVKLGPDEEVIHRRDRENLELRIEVAELRLLVQELEERKRPNATPEQEEEIIQLVLKGCGPTEIGEKVGRPAGGVTSIIKRLRNEGRL